MRNERGFASSTTSWAVFSREDEGAEGRAAEAVDDEACEDLLWMDFALFVGGDELFPSRSVK